MAEAAISNAYSLSMVGCHDIGAGAMGTNTGVLRFDGGCGVVSHRSAFEVISQCRTVPCYDIV